jgi:hypothetical protein
MTVGPTLKSAQITNLDATPAVANSAGAGAAAYMKQVDGYVTAAAADAATTKYKMVRLPSTAVVKKVAIESEAQGAGKVDVGVWYADDARYIAGGSANTGLVIDQDFFATDVDLASAVVPTDITNESGTYTIDKRAQPLWQAVGLTSDPGGSFDIQLTVHTTDVTTGTGKIYLRVDYVTP